MKIFWKIWGVLMAGGLFVMVVFGFTVMASMQEVNRSQSDSLAVMQQLVKEGPKDGASSTKTQKAESALRNIDTQTRQRVIRKFIMFFAPALLAVTLMGLMTSWYVCHSLNKPLSGVGATLKAIASGDLTQSVEYEFPPYGLVRETDEIGRMIGQLDDMREGLARVVRDTKGNVGGVEGASDDFMKSATGLSESMATLWQLLKEVEGSVERISSHLMFVAGHIPQALRRTGETVNDIGHIQTSLQEVSGAVKALDEFVDDTAGVVAEFGTTMENINQNTLSLKGQVEESAQVITDMVESINNASGRSDHLSRSVSKTVSAIEEMVMSLTSLRQMAEGMDESLRSTESAMSFLVQSSKDVEESAKSLGQTARQSKRLAEEGGDAVHRTMEGMNNIQRAVLSATRTVRSLGDEGKKIGEIVDTVAAIAEQTNLLALNAAIEAARAGEQGKGFAVVADEVRQLAEKSQRSTKEIAAMITKIRQGTEEAVRSMEEGNNEVRHGHELATEAGETLGRIVEGVRQTSTLIDQIVEKTTEQNAQGENLRRVMGEVLRYGENVREFTRKQEGGTKSMKRTMGELKDIAMDLKDHTALQLQGTGRIQGTVEKLRAITQHIAVSTDQQHEGATQMQHSIQAIKTKTAAIKSATEQQARDGDRILEASNDMKRTLEQVGIRVKDLEGDSHGLVDRTQRAFGVVQNTREEAEKVHEKTQDLQKVVVSLRKSVQRFTISPAPITGGPRVTGMRLLEEGGEG